MSSTQQLILGEGAGGAPAAYQISRSLRFDSASSPNLNRTWSTPTNAKIGTLSFWCKRSKLGDGSQVILQNSTNAIYCGFDNNNTGDDKFGVYLNNNTTKQVRVTTQVFRDPSAWYHFVLAIDTANATAANRLKFYVNNVQVSDFSTSNTIDQNIDVFTADTYRIGSYSGTVEFLDGYLTEVNFIDGQALTPSSFGQANSGTGVWEPIAYTGTYGANGFYLNFSDNSNTTSTTLGKDYSGNGNNWTPTAGFSVAAGVGNDSLVDTPTPYGTDTGAGGEVRGNYATLNPLTLTYGTLSNGNLNYVGNSTNQDMIVATSGQTTGKWYCEVTLTNATAADQYSMGGVVNLNSYTPRYSPTYPGGNAASWGYYPDDGGDPGIYNNSARTDTLAAGSTNDVIGMALDCDAGTLAWYKNNSLLITKTIGSGNWAFVVGHQGANCNINFGQRPFAYTAPSGFKALCTQNLPTPTIGATATTRADDYFNTVLYTGTTPTTNAITGLGFAPDLVWVKSRTVAESHNLVDKVRGNNLRLRSNTTDAELSATFTLDSDGFTVGANTESNNGSMVGWAWKANGAGSSNTSGTITSTVSANQTAGFSIVTYTGNGTSGATVGHGCLVNGAATTPEMLIFKNRDATDGWIVFQKYVGGTDDWWDTRLLLASTAARADNAGYLTAAPTSTLLTLSNTSPVNTSSQKYLIYCFAPVAGYSAFGSYTGNGSTDGPFVYTGFRPKFVMIKCTTTSYGWVMLDSARNTYNPENLYLYANLSDAEATFVIADFLSNGFKIKAGATTATNDNGQTFAYVAFAENPFKYSLAR